MNSRQVKIASFVIAFAAAIAVIALASGFDSDSATGPPAHDPVVATGASVAPPRTTARPPLIPVPCNPVTTAVEAGGCRVESRSAADEACRSAVGNASRAALVDDDEWRCVPEPTDRTPLGEADPQPICLEQFGDTAQVVSIAGDPGGWRCLARRNGLPGMEWSYDELRDVMDMACNVSTDTDAFAEPGGDEPTSWSCYGAAA